MPPVRYIRSIPRNSHPTVEIFKSCGSVRFCHGAEVKARIPLAKDSYTEEMRHSHGVHCAHHTVDVDMANFPAVKRRRAMKSRHRYTLLLSAVRSPVPRIRSSIFRSTRSASPLTTHTYRRTTPAAETHPTIDAEGNHHHVRYGMNCCKINGDDNRRNQRRRGNFREVIVISDDESEDETIGECEFQTPPSLQHRIVRSPRSSSRESGMRECWPFKRKNFLHQGQSSSGGKLKMPHSHIDPYQARAANHLNLMPMPEVADEPVQLSQYRLSLPSYKSVVPSVNQCQWCLQEIHPDHPNFIPLNPISVDNLNDEDTITQSLVDGWNEWWNKTFNTPPKRD
ncbi:hypothetical protein ZOSMA_344G00100 [Zostera marina]|uniref:Uncharacterized protein n=1 Tax=Zostera marina TaxID=29655 RepID=A0A0K9P9Q7_ZOSMR|nr:hypothetical protein ZOSMA_344G00100 [Zostera marina]